MNWPRFHCCLSTATAISRSFSGFAFMSIIITVQFAQASMVSWTVQSAQSSLQVAGKATFSGLTQTVSPQGLGANIAALSGSLSTDWTPGTSIDFVPSNLSLLNSGSWSPLPGGVAGSAPADYGLQAIAVKTAIRDAQINLDSPLLSLTGTPSLSTFVLSGNTGFSAGYVDYLITAFGGASARSSDFIGSQGAITGTGSIAVAAGIATLTLNYTAPTLNVTIEDNNTPATSDDITGVLTLTGQIVATAIVPEPASWTMWLGGVGLIGVAGAQRRWQRIRCR
jgi:hypothetical protein